MQSVGHFPHYPPYSWSASPPWSYHHEQPHYRNRSNTWPRNVMESWEPSNPQMDTVAETVTENVPEETKADDDSKMDDVPYGRRNPWGPFSYAQLITQAISSSAEGRMTLHQIYEYLIYNFDYFAERRSNEKSAGWKNSIRHNLSLHQKFQKVRNEGIGRSSWWVINPDLEQGKASQRRRATSGDVKSLQTKRDIARSRVERRRKSSDEGRPKSTNLGTLEDDIDLDQFDILKFIGSEEIDGHSGFDICFDSLNIAQDLMMSDLQSESVMFGPSSVSAVM